MSILRDPKQSDNTGNVIQRHLDRAVRTPPAVYGAVLAILVACASIAGQQVLQRPADVGYDNRDRSGETSAVILFRGALALVRLAADPTVAAANVSPARAVAFAEALRLATRLYAPICRTAQVSPVNMCRNGSNIPFPNT